MRFDLRYSEVVRLPDGSRIKLRTLLPSDRDKLVQGFEQLSDESRYMRFFSPKHALSERELDFLTLLDGLDHFGIAAFELGEGEMELGGVAIARFIRSAENPGIGEPAVTVIDSFQGRGLGRVICHRLALAALERRLTRFRCLLLPENSRVRHMVSLLFPEVHFSFEGSFVQVDLDLEGVLEPRPE